MGIPPYCTPVERADMDVRIKHYDQFLKERGYVNCYTLDPNDPRHDCYLPRTGFKAKDGKVYGTAEEFRKGTGWCPGIEKDGICYGWYQPGREDGYIDPWDDQVKFLEERGYKRISVDLSEDYIENINLEKAYFEKHGTLPRWEKEGNKIGHPEALKLEGYKYDYPGMPKYEQ